MPSNDTSVSNTDSGRHGGPGTPIARLFEAEKQIELAIHHLETESEHVDPDPLQQIDDALETLRGAANTLDAQARTTETELNGGEGQ